MPFSYFDTQTNFAKSAVSAIYNSSATSVTLNGGGSRFPQPSTDGPFNIVWWNSKVYPDPNDDPDVEICRVTARVGDVLTLTRAQEGTAASNKNTAGGLYTIANALTKNVMTQIRDAFTALGNPTFATDDVGTDFSVSNSGRDYTFHLPIASPSASGKVTTSAQTFAGVKTFFAIPKSANVPSAPDDIPNKAYVDITAQGLSIRASCRVATVVAGNLATDFEFGDVIDGITLDINDRVLIKDQAVASENGIYTVNVSGAPTRSLDYDTSAEVNAGTFTTVTFGAANQNTLWAQITQNPILGTDPLVFTQLAKPPVYTGSLGVKLIGSDFRLDYLANDGLILSGNSITVAYDNTTLGIRSTKLAIKDTTVTPGSYTAASITVDQQGRITAASNGVGVGNVVGPVTNTNNFIPQWNGTNSLTLKDGLAVPAGGLAGLTLVNTKVTANAPITPGTNTKITYDASGLVTAGVAATTTDIPDSTNFRYVTDAELAVIAVTSGVNTGDQTITLSSEASGSGTGGIAVTLSNAAVIAKVLTGFTSTTGSVTSSDSIFTAIRKLYGNSLAVVSGVSSVFGRTGAVVAATNDYTFAQIGSKPTTLSGYGITDAVQSNVAITPGTNTKITYDAKGLVTAGVAATTADINDSLNRRYVTDAELAVIAVTSGTNTGDQIIQDHGSNMTYEHKINFLGPVVTVTDNPGNNSTDITITAGNGTTLKKSVHQVAHGLSVGNAIRSNGTGGQFAKAQADSAAHAEVIGYVTAVTGADDFEYSYNGIITTGVPTATAGTTYFLDPSTAGAITATEPTTVGQISKPVLEVITSATEAKLIIEMRGEELIDPPAAGDVVGPGFSVNDNVAFWDGATGLLLKDNGITLSGSNTGDQVISDATLTLTTGSTTGDFTITTHGFVPIGTNVGNFLKDDGTWGVPAGAGDMLLASVQTVTALKSFVSGTLKFLGATSGGVTVNAPAVAGAVTVVLPSSAGTLALTTDRFDTELVGDVTAGPGHGTLTATIAGGAVTLSKMANLTSNTIIGNNTGGSTTPLALTTTQVKTMLAIAESDVSGLVADLALKAPLASPTFTGIVTFPTPFVLGATTVNATGAEMNQLVGVTGSLATMINGVTISGSSTPTIVVTGTANISGTTSGTNTGDNTVATALLSASTTVSVSAATAPTAGQVLTATSGTAATWQNAGTGTVTAVSVATVNGFAGSSSGGATPALTISTTITGIVKGNGTAISAATSGVDYSAGTSSLATGIVKSTTTTGALTIAIAADFPTLNQDTTGKSAKTDALNSATTVVNVAAATAPTTGQVLTATSSTTATWQTPTAGGVTSVAISGANGITVVSGSPITTSGTIALTLGAITPTSVNASGTVLGSNLSGTNTGDQSTIAALTTPRNIYGNPFDGTADLNQIITSTYGGTENGFTKFTGPTTSQKIFTLPNASDTIGCLGTVGTWTASQSFNSSKLLLKGSSSGFVTLNAPAVASTYVQTLPAATTNLIGDTDTATVTNKRITKRVGTVASSATPTINTDNVDDFSITALATNITSMTSSLSGTPTAFQGLIIRILDNGTSRTITWGSSFANRGASLPSATVAGKYMYVGLIWNEVASKWDCISVAQEV